MPTYEYECRACGHTLEAFQGISEKPLVKCPRCGKRKLRRLIGAGAGLIFRGDGFYITDYRSKEYREAAKKESGGGSKAEKPEKSGKKPDARSDSGASKPASEPAKPASKKAASE